MQFHKLPTKCDVLGLVLLRVFIKCGDLRAFCCTAQHRIWIMFCTGPRPSWCPAQPDAQPALPKQRQQPADWCASPGKPSHVVLLHTPQCQLLALLPHGCCKRWCVLPTSSCC